MFYLYKSLAVHLVALRVTNTINIIAIFIMINVIILFFFFCIIMLNLIFKIDIIIVMLEMWLSYY